MEKVETTSLTSKSYWKQKRYRRNWNKVRLSRYQPLQTR